MKEIDIISSDPVEMKKQLFEEVRAILKEKGNFRIKASISQNIIFKSEHGTSIEQYMVKILMPQKPIYKRRSLI